MTIHEQDRQGYEALTAARETEYKCKDIRKYINNKTTEPSIIYGVSISVSLYYIKALPAQSCMICCMVCRET